MHRALSAIQNNRVSTFQGEVYIGTIGPIVGTLESVQIIEVSAFQGCPQGRVPLYRGTKEYQEVTDPFLADLKFCLNLSFGRVPQVKVCIG